MDGTVVYHVSYTVTREGKLKLKLYMTGQDGFRAHPVFLDPPIQPYFFALQSVVDMKGVPEGARAELIDTNRGRLYKVSTTEPGEVVGLRGFYDVKNTFEADVPYSRRVMIDRDLTISLPAKRLYVDIECDPREGVPDEVLAEKCIMSITGVDQDGQVYYFSSHDEVAMLSQFLILMDKYPVVCTWYGNHFDWEYLKNRCQRLDMRFFYDPFVHVDLLVLYRDTMQIKREHYGLDYIAEAEELPHKKADVKVSELWESFEGDGQKLKARNVADALIIRDLDQKLSMTQIIFDIAKATHTSVKDLLKVNEKNNKDWNPSIAIDGLHLFNSGRRTPLVVWPSKEFKEETPEEQKKKNFIGALVLEPVPGLHKNVVILDVKSLYPSIIRTLNVGWDTYRTDGSGDIGAPIGSFVSEPESIMAEGIRAVTELRERYRREKDKCAPNSTEYWAAYSKEYAMKIVNNSVYGVSGSKHSRYFNKDVAENVTLTGQQVTSFMKQELETLGYQVIYGDTDSVMVVLPVDEPDVVGTAKFLVSYMTERGRSFLEEKFHPKKAYFSLDISAICQTLLFTKVVGKDKGTKKRYAGLVMWQKEQRTFYMMKKGFEMVRHDSTKLQKEVQEEMLWRKLLEDKTEELVMAANEWKKRLFSGELNDKVVTWKGFGKKVSKEMIEKLMEKWLRKTEEAKKPKSMEEDEDERMREKLGDDEDEEEDDPEGYKVLTPALRAAHALLQSGVIARINKGDKVAYVKTGPKPDQVKPVVEDEKLVLTEAELAYIFEAQLKHLFDRLEIPVESEKAKYKPIRIRKSKT